jgi:hypothetical protein
MNTVLRLFCFIALSMIAHDAAAGAYFGCINHQTYVCPTVGGEVHCYHVNHACNFNGVMYINRAHKPGFTHTPRVSDRTAAEVVRIMAELRRSDVQFYFRATEAVYSSWLLRAGLSSQGTIDVSERKLPGWLQAGMASGTFSSGTVEAGSCSGNLYPNPRPDGKHGCYPCLACIPCGKEYCSIRGRLTATDLSPELARQGYTVRNGRLRPPALP